MLSNKITLLILTLSIILGLNAYAEDRKDYDKYFYAVLDTYINKKHAQVLDRLDDLRNNSKKANEFMVELLDYYIGEGPSELLEQYIIEQGDKILPLLIKKRGKHLECLQKYKQVCMDKFDDGLEIRNEEIDRMIDTIKKDKKYPSQ